MAVKRLSVFLIVTGIFFLSIGCSNRKTKGIARVGIFQFTSNPLLDATKEGILTAISDAGFTDGDNIEFKIKNAQGDLASNQLIVQSFIQDRVDLICAISTPSLQAALNSTPEIPIVFGAIANPYRVDAGRDSVDHRPNVTGASAPSPIGKGLEMVLRIIPDARRIGTLWNPSEENSQYDMERARTHAARLGLELIELPVTSSSEVLMSAEALAQKDIDAYMQILDNIVCASFDSVVKAADKYGIPLFTLDTQYAGKGASITLGWDYFANGYKSGQLAVRILKGENPADIPFQSLDKAKFYVNLSAAKKQGLTIPEHILAQADEILE